MFVSKVNATTFQPRSSQDDHYRSLTRFDAMPTKGKVKWVEAFASRKALDAASCRVLRHELPALARSVGIGWSWGKFEPLRLRDVQRVHAAVREGVAALKASGVVRRATVEEMRATAEGMLKGARRRRASTAMGWQLPAHRTRLRLLPQPALGEQTSMLALFEGKDAVSVIVAAFGYFLWRQEPPWCECACGCALTFIRNGKQKFARGHQARNWQKNYRRKNRDEIGRRRKASPQSRRRKS